MKATTPKLPAGYALHVHKKGPVTAAHVVTNVGGVAAQGFSAVFDEFRVYDRIETSAGHRRQGLARAVMQALSPPEGSELVQVLVATAEGKRLYDSLGWITVSPYATAELSPRSSGL